LISWKGQTRREAGTQSHRSWTRQRGCQWNAIIRMAVRHGLDSGSFL